jgi:phenylacetate-CoA ligase
MGNPFYAAVRRRRNDIVHNAYGYGLFTGGLGVHYGAEKLGASVIPISGGNTRRQVMIMKDFGPTVLTCTPSYAASTSAPLPWPIPPTSGSSG